MAEAQQLRVFLVFLAVVARGDCLRVWDTTIYVSDTGTDSPSCRTSGTVTNACRTLQYAAEGIADSTRIILLRGNHSLNSTIRITRHRDIAVMGTEEMDSFVVCSHSRTTNGSGIHVENIVGLYVANLTFFGCGSLANSTTVNNRSPNSTVRVRSALYIMNSTDVNISSSHFLNGTGTGVILYDVNGLVAIDNSTFFGNAVPEDEKDLYPGGNGVNIEHTYCTPGRTASCDYTSNPFSNGSTYFITNSLFAFNKGNPPERDFVPDKGPVTRIIGRGGGVVVTLKGLSAGNELVISGCTFVNNSGHDGGSLWVSLQDYAFNNSIHVSDSLFRDNHVASYGGSVIIGIEFYSCDQCVARNDIQFTGVDFIGNSAVLGGAVNIFSSQMSENTGLIANNIKFSDCSWQNNTAEVGSAVMLNPEAWNSLTDGYLPTPVFDNCSFIDNTVITKSSNDPQLSTSTGALFISTYTVNFTSTVIFSRNIGTAVYINSGSINVLENTSVVFDGNRGNRGGAVAMLGFSAIRTFQGSNLTFMNNFAEDVGGAVYSSSTDEINYYFSRSCFLRYFDTTATPDNWNSSFTFCNNSAKHYGHSIYATSLLPCARAAATNSSMDINITDVFCWPHFHYSDPNNSSNIASDPSSLNVTTPKIHMSPGEIINLHPIARDDLNHTVNSVYKAHLSNLSGQAEIDSTHVYISDGNIRITGTVNSTFELTLQTIGVHQVGGSVEVTLIKCPLGFSPNGSSTNSKCGFSTYEGISLKDSQAFQALLNKGFWAGCDDHGHLLTSECPLGYCKVVRSNVSYVPLNKTCEAQDEHQCGARSRTGVLCGDCKKNHTVHFHSQRYRCDACNHTELGWLFYLLSEILPVTLLFLVIMIFNVSLTSGAANCFILFAQVLDFFEVDSLGTVTIPHGVKHLSAVYQFVFGIFNLDFFRFDELSFCLWDGASVLHVLMFKYITTAYALALVLLLVVFFRVFPYRWSCRYIPIRNSSVIHGITAFLIMSYAQCARVSMQVLTRGVPMEKGPNPTHGVVFLKGTMKFLGSDHLPYAVSAILVLIFFCTLPPLLLLVYPLLQKILGWPVAERFDRCLAHVPCRPMQTLKPILDSFQGCYKDNLRFFAGLYFIYRLFLAAAFSFTTTAVQFYLALEIIVVMMLAIHAITQPYIKRFYNIVDTVIFADLAIINGISLYNYYCSQYQRKDEHINFTSSVQIALIYIPIFYIVFLSVLKLAAHSNRLRHKLRYLNHYLPIYNKELETPGDYSEIRERSSSEPFDPDHLPARLFEESSTGTLNTSQVGSIPPANYGSVM